ncbi:MAG: hypothetical protein WCH39_17265 [Schlesneria sp.]
MPKHRPVAAASVVLAPGVPSFVTLVLRPGETFPAVAFINHPITVEDKENNTTLIFTASLVTSRTDQHRAILKLYQTKALPTRLSGTVPTDGTLSITLVDTSSGTSTNMPALEMPVTYIDDPSAP